MEPIRNVPYSNNNITVANAMFHGRNTWTML